MSLVCQKVQRSSDMGCSSAWLAVFASMTEEDFAALP